MLWKDFQFAIRILRSRLVLTSVTVVSLALVIGANTAVFSLIDAFLLRSLPVHRPEQLVAFAGLDPTVFQTGQYDGPRQRISKRGSPFLRRTLWGMALRSLQQEGDLRDYWLRKRREGTHHLAAVTTVAAKICRRAWRILTDQRDYLPQPPNPKA